MLIRFDPIFKNFKVFKRILKFQIYTIQVYNELDLRGKLLAFDDTELDLQYENYKSKSLGRREG